MSPSSVVRRPSSVARFARFAFRVPRSAFRGGAWSMVRGPLSVARWCLLQSRRRAFRVLFLAALVAAVAASGLLLVLLDREYPVADFEQVRAGYQQSEAQLLDRQGRLLHELRVQNTRRRLEWVRLDQISPALLAAIVSSEDRRFYGHAGIDWVGLAGALVDNLRGRDRGASTVTMQLAGLLDPQLGRERAQRTPRQKWKQMRAARALERAWTKPQILEAYLNLVTFRSELQGIGAAARGLFGKQPHGLRRDEALLLAALLRSPNAAPAGVATRARALARVLDWPEAAAALQSAKSAALTSYAIEPRAQLAPHVARLLLGENRQSTACTLDAELQRLAMEAVARQVAQLSDQNVHDAAVLVVDNKSGDVLAYVGNTGAGATARYVDGVRARRQAGSVLKPFLYALALDRRILTAASLVEDSAVEFAVPGGMYRPRNYDNSFAGLVSVRTALASSLNVPAVKTLNLVGVDGFVTTLRQLGLAELKEGDYYGSSLALGTADVSLWELVGAYRSLARGGLYGPLHLKPQTAEVGEARVFTQAAAFVVADILADRESRSRTFGLENALATRFWSAVKTGTSKEMRDNWCVGFSSRYSVGVWVGNFSGEPMWNVSGVTGAAPVWAEIINWLHRERDSVAPLAPAGLQRRDVRIVETGQDIQEWFLPGTELAVVSPATVTAGPARILYPVSGMVVAIDPDIPDGDQRLFFESEVERGSKTQWILDGQAIGPAAQIQMWHPVAGKHTLQLRDGERVVDSVVFEVRGQSTQQ